MWDCQKKTWSIGLKFAGSSSADDNTLITCTTLVTF